VVDDDMTPLYDKIISTDLIILASPIFFYGITAQAKAFIDRTQALWNRKRLLMEKGEWQENPDRRGFFISVAATSGTKIFEGAVLTMKYGYDAMGTAYAGELLVTGADRKGDMAKFEKKLQEAEEAGRNFLINQPAHVD
jgi:multimeric flavodoxin WrbA